MRFLACVFPLRTRLLQWFDPAATENYAWGFVKLVLRCPEALTPDELALFTHLRNIGGLMINGRTEVGKWFVISRCSPF